jgi:hypothetical protein
MPKTGTTYLQSVLHASADELARQGVVMLPPSRREAFWLSLAVRDAVNQRRDPPAARSALTRFADDLAACEVPTAVVSDELIGGAVDDQVASVLGDAAHEYMDMRIVGIPVIDRHPVEPGFEILLHPAHEIAGEGPKVLKLLGIFRADDEAEMMAIVGAAICEGLTVGGVSRRIEHHRFPAIARDAVAFQISDMPCERRGAKLRALMPDDARHDRHAALRGAAPDRRKRGAAAAMPTGSAATAAAATRAGVTRAGGGLAHLRGEPFPAPRRS